MILADKFFVQYMMILIIKGKISLRKDLWVKWWQMKLDTPDIVLGDMYSKDSYHIGWE